MDNFSAIIDFHTDRTPDRVAVVDGAVEVTYRESGRRLSAAEALQLGVVDEVVEPSATWARALEVARSFGSAPRFAVRAVEEAVDHAGDGAGFALERALIAGLFATRDREIGLRSFLEEGPGRGAFG